MRELILGIDIGTSASKLAVFDKNGEVICSVTEAYSNIYPKPGWTEQDPEIWYRSVCCGLKKMFCSEHVSASEISVIAIDGQSWAPVYLDAYGNCLANAPLWMDTRSDDICIRLTGQIGAAAIFEVAGNPLQPTYTTAKVLWLKENFPEVFRKVDKVLSTNGFIAYKLTGSLSMDKSQGYAWHCFHMQKEEWDLSMARELGIPSSILCDLVECDDVVGTVSAKASGETGLIEGTKVVAGGVDAACATLGAGVIHDGECQEQGGQAGGISLCIDTYRADPQLILGPHVVPGKWLLQGGTTGGGGVMRWMEQELGEFERLQSEKLGISSFEQFNQLAETIKPGCDGLVFLPYMSGERTPIWDPNAKGVYYGLDYSKTKAHMIRAALEGVAFSLRHNISAAEELGCSIQQLRATGGSANSVIWTQIKADVTGKDFVVPCAGMATVLGTAMVAGTGAGIYENYEDAVKHTIHIQRVHHADQEKHPQYEDNYQIYLELYRQLKGIMNR